MNCRACNESSSAAGAILYFFRRFFECSHAAHPFFRRKCCPVSTHATSESFPRLPLESPKRYMWVLPIPARRPRPDTRSNLHTKNTAGDLWMEHRRRHCHVALSLAVARRTQTKSEQRLALQPVKSPQHLSLWPVAFFLCWPASVTRLRLLSSRWDSVNGLSLSQVVLSWISG